MIRASTSSLLMRSSFTLVPVRTDSLFMTSLTPLERGLLWTHLWGYTGGERFSFEPRRHGGE